jgi:seryl-tRNA synthetase
MEANKDLNLPWTVDELTQTVIRDSASRIIFDAGDNIDEWEDGKKIALFILESVNSTAQNASLKEENERLKKACNALQASRNEVDELLKQKEEENERLKAALKQSLPI